MAKIAIIMGSKSDFAVVKPAVGVIKSFGEDAEVRVISAHRTPEEAREFSSSAKERGIEVIICAAGKAAHLGGVIAADTTLPVIGLPVKTDMMGGLDSLLSIVQMPSGIPVATVGVNVASIWGEVGASCETAYSASKGAVIAFTKALAKELAPSKVRVNCVSPGVIDTQMNSHLTEEETRELIESIPLGRIGYPEDVAKACLYLAEADYVTGEILSVGGGFAK